VPGPASRLERLVNLTAALIDADRPLSREELRRRVGGYAEDPAAFRRTFERDKDLLRQMGMPVTTEPLDPDRPDMVGYRIRRDDYELPDAGLAEDELAALRLATSAVRLDVADGTGGSDGAEGTGGPGGAGATALRKLAAVPAGAVGEDGVPVPAAAVPVDERAATVFGAVAERRRLRFTYKKTPRLVDPWRMSYRNGQWYLSGFDHGRGEQRLYRLDRVTGAVTTDGDAGAFERPANGGGGPARPWQIGDDDEVTVDLHVDAEQVPWALEQLGAATVVERRADGSVRFAVPVRNVDAFRTFVVGLLDHAEVLGPPAVRAGIVEWLAAVAAGDTVARVAQ
jgi:predicted DNA-binding transcriptional regulator YafY